MKLVAHFKDGSTRAFRLKGHWNEKANAHNLKKKEEAIRRKFKSKLRCVAQEREMR